MVSDAQKIHYGCGEVKEDLGNRVCWRKNLCDDCMRLRKGCGKLFERKDDVGMTKCKGRTLCPECDVNVLEGDE